MAALSQISYVSSDEEVTDSAPKTIKTRNPQQIIWIIKKSFNYNKDALAFMKDDWAVRLKNIGERANVAIYYCKNTSNVAQSNSNSGIWDMAQAV